MGGGKKEMDEVGTPGTADRSDTVRARRGMRGRLGRAHVRTSPPLVRVPPRACVRVPERLAVQGHCGLGRRDHRANRPRGGTGAAALGVERGISEHS